MYLETLSLHHAGRQWCNLKNQQRVGKNLDTFNTMKRVDKKSRETIFGGWDFLMKIGSWTILDHRGNRTGDKWHWWFE